MSHHEDNGRWRQIMPANGWYALFVKDDGRYMQVPLVCWAWVQRFIKEDDYWSDGAVGVVPDGDGGTVEADLAGGLIDYAQEDELTDEERIDEWMKRADEIVEQRKKNRMDRDLANAPD